MDRRRLLLSLAGFGVAVVISTPGIASDLCKSPRLGVTPSWCDTKSTEKPIPEGHVAASHERGTSGLKTHTATRAPRAFRPPKSLRPQTGHKTSRR